MLAETLPLRSTASSAALAHTRRNTLLFAAFAVIAGGVDALLLIGWRQIDPTSLAWIRKDPAQYQAGWEFLRHAPWAFPLTWLPHLDYPFGISAAYLDVIPIVAVPLRLFAGILPQNFQYLGLWAVLCLVLQTYFALKLLSRFTTDRLVLCLGALFFLNAPILLNRLYGHFSLCSQWLILAALYYYFRPADRARIARYMVPFVVIAAIAGGITPYITVMVLAIGCAAVLRVALERVAQGEQAAIQRPQSANWRDLVLWPAIPAAAALLAFLVFGFIVPGSGPSVAALGYGTFSLNLLSPISPLHGSLLFKPFQLIPAQAYEGYAYLGLGILALGIACLAIRPSLLKRLAAPSLRPLVLLSVVMTLLALSVRITFGPKTVALLPVPLSIFHLLQIFRSSGRFFWPVYYLLMLAAIVGTASAIRSRATRRAIIAACLLLQYADTAGMAADLARETRITVADPLVSAAWKGLAKTNPHMVIVPAFQCDRSRTPGGEPAWHWFAWFAARQNLTLNSVNAARFSKASDRLNCAVLPQQLARGRVETATVYVLNNRLASPATAANRALHCRRIDGLDVCALNLPVSAALNAHLMPAAKRVNR